MNALVEDFLQYLRHERGQAEHTQKTYAALLGKFTAWAGKHDLHDWQQVELKHLMAFLQHERARPLADEPKESTKRLSSESVYLEIAALRAFYRFAENEKLLPQNVAENDVGLDADVAKALRDGEGFVGAVGKDDSDNAHQHGAADPREAVEDRQ